MRERVIRAFDRGAATYDQVADIQKKAVLHLAANLSHVKPNRILEIGCGTGLLSRHLIHLFPEAHIALTDISPAMLATCSRQFSLNPNVAVFFLDGEGMTVDHSVDLIISSMTLHWFSDVTKSMETIFNQLRPGQQFIFSLLGKNSFKEWQAICDSFSILSGTLSFPSHTALQEKFPTLKMKIENHIQPYDTLYAFLTHLKQLGAHTSKENYASLHSSTLRKILRHAEKKIDISYEIIYGCYEK